MRPAPLPAYRPHPSIVIVKGRASTHGRSGNRFELTSFRYVNDDGEVRDVLHQQRRDRDGRHECDLPIDYASTPAQMFDTYVERYRLIAEQADGVRPGASCFCRVCHDRRHARRPQPPGSSYRSMVMTRRLFEQRWRRGRDRWVHPDGPRFVPARYEVAPIDESQARPFIETHHDAHSSPAARFAFGLLDTWFEALVGVAVNAVPVNAAVLTTPSPV